MLYSQGRAVLEWEWAILHQLGYTGSGYSVKPFAGPFETVFSLTPRWS